MKYLLAHDLGTSGDKVTLFTTEGTRVKSCVHSYGVKWYNDVWAEQNPQDWFEAFCHATQEILADIDAKDVLGVSFSGQMMGCLCVDDTGKPLHDSIIWADTRATEEEAWIASKIEPWEFYQITGHRPSASNSMAKLLWIKNHKKEIYDATYKMLNAKDYILFKLTGRFVTDYSDASGTNLLDLSSLSWSTTIAEAVGLDLAKMPELKKSTDIIGFISEEVAKITGLAIGTPIVCGGGDGSMATVGAGCIEDGDSYITIGTSAWNAMTTSEPILDKDMRIFNFAHIVPGKFVPCGAMQTAGASVSWMIKELGKEHSRDAYEKNISVYERINQMIEESEVGANGTIFLPYLLGERSPRWNNDVRGCFLGLKIDTCQKDIFRAVYEGVAMNLELIYQIFREHSVAQNLVITGGGALSRIWCQIFADMFNLQIRIPKYTEEATSIGAAVTAGVGIGIYEDFTKICDFNTIETTIYPDPEHVERYNQLKPIFDQAYFALEDVFVLLQQFTKHEQ